MSLKRTAMWVLTCALAGLSAWACDPAPSGPQGTVRDSAGITLVTFTGEDRSLAWSVERETVIPSAAQEDQGFLGVADLAVTRGAGEDRIAVLDRDGKQVVLHTADGELVGKVGREGSGPGEFQYPIELAARPGGGISIFDLMNRRLERFDSALGLLPSDPFQVEFFGGGMAYVDSFLVFETTPFRDASEDRLEVLTAVSAHDTLEIVRYERESGGVVELSSCGMTVSGMPEIFAPGLLWSAPLQGPVAVVGTGEYQVDFYGAPTFQLQRIVRRDVPEVRATRAMAEASVGESMRVMTPAGYRVCDAAEVVEKRGFAPVVPPISGIAVSPGGWTYLERRGAEGTEPSVDVLDPQGRYLGTLPPGFPFPHAFLEDFRIVREEQDELGLSSVVVYRINRAEGTGSG